MLTGTTVVVVSFAYLLLLFAVAYLADRRAEQGRSVISNPWTYALSLGVYCTAWTYFGSVGRAASGGVWFLPIYLGPTLAMTMSWIVMLKMIRIAKTYRITSIADFIASRYGKSHLLGGLVTIIAVVGMIPYIALQLKAVSSGYAVLTGERDEQFLPLAPGSWVGDSTLYVALTLAVFTVLFGTRHLDATERHEGMVAAIAFESVVKLFAFLVLGVFVTYGMYDGFGDLFTRALAHPELAGLLTVESASGAGYGGWFTLTLLAMLSVIFLPRQFQVMVVENVNEQHLRRATWLFPTYLFLINIFVLPIALGGLLFFGRGTVDPDTFVLSLPLAHGHGALALLAFVGGLSAATGMVIVETIAVSTMVCNDLVMPLVLRSRSFHRAPHGDLTGLLLGIRRGAILVVLLLGYLYFHLAGEAYALVSIGLISFAAVAQFAPVMLGGMYWRGGTREGALAGLLAGFVVWAYTLMLPSVAKSGWLDPAFLEHGLFGIALLRPEQLFGLRGLDNISHALFWSLTVNIACYLFVSLLRTPTGQEASQATLFVDVFRRGRTSPAMFWRGSAQVRDLLPLVARFLGTARAERAFTDYARQRGLAGIDQIQPDAGLVQFAETQLAGAIGSASARVMVASVVQEEPLGLDEVMDILDEASQVRAYSHELEEKSRALESATAELRAANERLKELDRLKDDFMSSVSHELRTPLTSIRAFSEMLLDDPDIALPDRMRFLGIIVSETERLTRLVNQVLDLAKIESGHAEWHNSDIDMRALVEQAVDTTAQLFRDRGATVELVLPDEAPHLKADHDRLVQVMLNLLSNAAKFVPQGAGRIRVALKSEAGQVRVEVSDNGPGIPPELHGVIFEKFRQGGDERSRPQGTGLGLPISRQIVEHFGGRLWVESPPGHGTVFTFVLPLHAPHPDTVAVVQ
ncbi:sensor histidine kinase [Aromatoleum aromaticum]|uniref:histidine kinase n=1 Tax=Aromatoleum aromaticum (strain DSM 19018 / LMG 30748 / EbN1) TaxID=76114 RepID=Q5P8Z3_AROAE|nr:sensor histidine kinase [Aromatoleum aromaticum]NMG54940.1 histidine kinase [Aromatoleum aromaticum]CAI06216.1 Fusion protein of probable Na-dependent permease domain and histidine kinase domain of putative two-component sensor [Aromatoleum aromaticum EbN1]